MRLRAFRRRGGFGAAIGALLAALGTATPAVASDASVDVGLTVNPVLGGFHESFNDRAHVPPIPIPLLEVRGNYGPFELYLDGLPPLASVQYFDSRQGHTSTNLSIFEGVLRVWDPLRRFSFGVGQTLYNQSTHYADAIEIPGTGETQFSRVTGASYEAGYRVPVRRGRFEATFDYAPVMLGTQYTLYDRPYYRRRADPERAEQIDTAVRYVRPAGRRGEVIFGLRYVNYTAQYAERNGGLSDRNVGLLPVIGYHLRLVR